jgi:ribonuclease HII
MKFVLGVDEAGRGPLAGPVSVGVVMVPEAMLPKLRDMFPGVNDSKKLTEAARERIYLLIEQAAKDDPDFSFCVQFASADSIDTKGIVPSVLACVARGVDALATDRDVRILLDGALRAPIQYAQETVIRGDSIHPIISLASIAAKVERDRLMKKLALEYPEYGFEKHKGYGTAHHYKMLEKHGPCVMHRRSFLPLDTRVGQA